MKHNFVWNSSSFEQSTDDGIFEQLKNALKGLACVPRNGDTAALYFDGPDALLCRKISDGCTVADFVDHLQLTDHHDVVSLLLELEDKANAIEMLPEEVVFEIANSAYYFVDRGYKGSVDFLGIAAEIDGILFGVNTENFWSGHALKFAVYRDCEEVKPYEIYSVCDVASGQSVSDLIYFEEPEQELVEMLPNCVLSMEFIEWFGALVNGNTRIVRKKLKLAHSRGFDGGEPLFKTLKDAGGMRELRMNAYPGGAIRILFGALKNDQIALLAGFIKKSSNDGYMENIQLATPIWNNLMKSA